MKISFRTFAFAALALSLSTVTALHAAENRVTAAIDPARNVTLVRHLHPAARPENDRGPVDPAMAIDYASLMLEPATGLEGFLAEQQNPSSANFHRWLTPEQFADRFGASSPDIAAISAWLRSQGLQVNDVARGHLWITFSGTAGRVGAAFHTTLHRYVVNGESHFANAGELTIPTALAGVIRGVDGLTDFVPVPLHVLGGKVEQNKPEYNGTGGTHNLAPGDLAVIYNAAPLYLAGIDGTGQKIAVVGRTDIDLGDMRDFRSRFGLPASDPQIILYGPDPGYNLTDEVEADLDLEWSGAIAPGAQILYVNSRSVNISAQYAVDQNLAPVMTMSYGSCELVTPDTLRPVAQQANAQGITWIASSGDAGAATCDRSAPSPVASKGATTSYPASIPEVTAVGGTEFAEGNGSYWKGAAASYGTSALSWIPEVVWNNSAIYGSLVGGGGAPSGLFAKPLWQSGPGVPADGVRDVPDISLAASAAHDSYLIVNEGFLTRIGGTSASAPAFAGIVALLNQSLQQRPGNVNPSLYRLAQTAGDVFHDVTQGNNQVPCEQGSPQCVDGLVGFAAGPGYDLAAGLGSVDVSKLIAEWNAGTVSTTVLSVPPDKVNPTDTVELTAVVTGDKGIPSGTVTFVANEVILGSVPLRTQAKSATATMPVSGILLIGGSGTIGALYGGDSVFAPSSGTAMVSANLPGAGSFVIPSVSPNPVLGYNNSWPYTVKLTELAGVATRVTVFTVNGVNNLSSLTSTLVPASGSVSTALSGNNLAAPLNRLYHFAGLDADGTPWTRDLTVPFLAQISSPLTPSIVLTLANPVARQNPGADASCQWSQEVSVQERGGFLMQLTVFLVNGVSMSSHIADLFGTTRLAPYGSLHANVCFSAPLVSATPAFSISGLAAETGSTVTATASAALQSASTGVSILSVSASTVTMSVSDAAQDAEEALDLNFGTGAADWAASAVTYGKKKWLTLSDAAGTGPATLKLKAAGSGLSNGVYSAMLTIAAPDAAPATAQAVDVPVVFVVGGSPDISIQGVSNAASYSQTFAPGMLMAVFGTNLAPALQSAATQPLPFSLKGVSVTINGVRAPLWFVSPGQLNVQIPYEVTAGPAVLGVNNNGKVASFIFPVTTSAPGIFADGAGALVPFASGKAGQTIVAFVTGDGDETPTLATGVTSTFGSSLSSLPHSRQSVGVSVGGEKANVVFNGIVPGLIGITQINFTIPADALPGPQTVSVAVGAQTSVPVNITVLAP